MSLHNLLEYSAPPVTAVAARASDRLQETTAIEVTVGPPLITSILAVPVMTIGCNPCFHPKDWHTSNAPPEDAKGFYAATVIFTLAAIGLNFFGINPMNALVFAEIVQGFSTPFLMLLVMLTINNCRIMGRWVNTCAMNVLGWLTTAAMSAAAIGLVVTMLK